MRIERIAVITLMAALLLGTAAPSRQHLDDSRLVDLTYPFDSQTIYWPTAEGFHWHKDSWGINDRGWWYASASYGASEHGGTHLDSPIHFAQGAATVEEVEITKLVGPAVVLDVSEKAARDRDYLISPDDVQAWERQHGRIPPHSIALVRAGWGKYWSDRKQYLGSDVPGDASDLHFPGISPAAAKLLVERGVDGVGLDTASLDHGPSRDFETHRVLGAAGIYGLENVANLERLPPTGATLIALPMKIRGGSGAPTRIIALLP